MQHKYTFLKVFGLILAILVTGIGTLLVFPGLLPRPTGGERDTFSLEETALLQPGDLVLRKGVGTPSDLIVTFMNDHTGVSHCAMVLESGPQGVLLLHSINQSLSKTDGVQIQELTEFNQNTRPESLVVVRPLIDSVRRERLLALSETYLRAAIPFDNGYNLSDRSSLYCSELFIELYESTGWWRGTVDGTYPNYRFSGPLVNFRTFLNPAYFRVIISHNKNISL